MKHLHTWLAAGLLTTQAVLLGAGAAAHSPVLDEMAHLAAGISHWNLGTYDLYKVNPPLVKMLAALPAMAAGAETDYTNYTPGAAVRAEFRVMDDFVEANGSRAVWLVTLARWGLMPLALWGGYVCYRWSRELYGDAAALMALTLWCFCPNVLAYSQVLTADAGAAALGATAGYLFWKWLRDPAWDRAVVAGIILGLAELAKTTWAVLFGLWPLLWFVFPCPMRASRGSRGFRLQLPQLAVMLGLALFVINVGYEFEGCGARLRDYTFLSRALAGAGDGKAATPSGNRFAKNWLGGLPVPLPKNYVEGIDWQWHDIEAGKPSYLRGQWQERGWWYWYLYALAVKVPLGNWGLFLLAVGVRAARLPARQPAIGGEIRATWRDELVLLAPAVVVLALVSSQTGFSRYIRYLLPMFPFLFIWISGVARCFKSPRSKMLSLATCLLLAWSIGGSLWYTPHWMSYFNELAGGPMGGPSHLIDAQVDWGQDLLYLKNWCQKHPHARPLGLAYFGPMSPTVWGVDFVLPPKGTIVGGDRGQIAGVPADLKPSWYAVSVNYLYGYPHRLYGPGGVPEWLSRPYYSYFRRFEPVATAGYSIYIYHLTRDQIEAAAAAGYDRHWIYERHGRRATGRFTSNSHDRTEQDSGGRRSTAGSAR